MLPDRVQAFIDAEIAANRTDFSDLRAVILNGTLKPSPTPSHTDGLIEVSSRVLRGVGARVDTIRVVDHTIPPGVYPDMRKQGWDVDDFPDLYRELIEPADIVVLATPIWLGDQSSMTRLVIERLYGWSGDLNEAAQMLYALSTSDSPFRPRPTPTGSERPARIRHTSTTSAARRTTGPPATPSSRHGTCSTPPGG